MTAPSPPHGSTDAFDRADRLTLSLVAVLGSRTLLTSFVSCPTLPPTAPLLTTNDLGTFGAFGSVAAGALTCETGRRRARSAMSKEAV